MIELRPAWCVDDSTVDENIELEHWVDDNGRLALARTGDDWTPGEGLALTRKVRLRVSPGELRRNLGLQAGAVVGIAARWACRATSTAGVHDEGPHPRPLTEDLDLSLTIPASVAGSLELETCLVVGWRDGTGGVGKCPDGGIIWSDTWSAVPGQLRVTLEGSEFRIPVQTVSFQERFGERSNALWSIGLDAGIDLTDIIANVATIYVNRDVVARDFSPRDGDHDLRLLPSMSQAAMNADLIRLLTSTLREQLTEHSAAATYPDGTVGQILTLNLDGAFGSVSAALRSDNEDPSGFIRALWSHFAPDSWADRR